MELLDNPAYRADVAAVAALELDWDQMRDTGLVLSGASGAIGGCLVDVLMARNRDWGLNCTITALARDAAGLARRFAGYGHDRRLDCQAVDVNTGPLPDAAGGDWVIHAASQTHPLAYAADPVATIMTNIAGTANLLDLAVRRQARRAVFLSTSDIYGDNRLAGTRFAETDLGYIDCNTLRAGYPESKRTGEALCQAYRQAHGLDVVIPRLPRVYGPTTRPDDSKAVAQFLGRALAGQDIVLKSDGHQYYSFGYVGDVVAGILVCLLAGAPGQAYNVAAAACDAELGQVARLIAAQRGVEVVVGRPDPAEARGASVVRTGAMDGSKLAGLGWVPVYDLAGGLERTLTILEQLTG